jgi:hypothetical protein
LAFGRSAGDRSAEFEVDQGSLLAAHIGGTAVIVSEGTLLSIEPGDVLAF